LIIWKKARMITGQHHKKKQLHRAKDEKRKLESEKPLRPLAHKPLRLFSSRNSDYVSSIVHKAALL